MAADPARTVESSQATATTSESSPKKTKEVSSSSPPSSVRNANGGPKKASGSSSKKAKRSFWSSLKATLFPCIPSDPSKSAHDISPDQIEPRTIAIEHPARTPTATVQEDSEPTKTDASGHEKEKGASLSEKEKPSQRVASTTAGPTNADSTSPATPPTPTTPTDAQANAGASGAHPSSKRIPAPITTAQQEADAKLVVPHTPTHTLLPVEETEGVTSGAVVPPGATGAETQLLQVPQAQTSTITSDSDDGSFTDDIDGDHEEQGKAVEHEFEDEDDEEERLILQGGTGIPIGPDGKPQPLLPPVAPMHKGRKCLVLDLDETLLHSSFKLIPQADYVVPVEIEWQWHNVYVIKRPGVDQFLKKMGELYEIVIFTASLSKYADPVLDKLDVHKVVAHRLFRESCYNHKGNYVKDLSRLGRPAEDMIILDNSPASYIFHPNNAVPVSSWFNDPHDTELTDLCPFLADLMHVDDVRGVLDGGL